MCYHWYLFEARLPEPILDVVLEYPRFVMGVFCCLDQHWKYVASCFNHTAVRIEQLLQQDFKALLLVKVLAVGGGI